MERYILRTLRDYLPSCVYLGKNVRKCEQRHLKHKSDILEEYAMEITAGGVGWAIFKAELGLLEWEEGGFPSLLCPSALTGT